MIIWDQACAFASFSGLTKKSDFKIRLLFTTQTCFPVMFHEGEATWTFPYQCAVRKHTVTSSSPSFNYRGVQMALFVFGQNVTTRKTFVKNNETATFLLKNMKMYNEGGDPRVQTSGGTLNGTISTC